MFLFNAWYIVAEPDEVAGGGVVARTLLGRRVAVYRGASGVLVGLDDFCPHRLAPLSLGTVVGDGIRCAYHGAEFGADGICVRVPGQKAVPPRARVRTYPVVERHGYIWIWMGDPAGATDESSIPEGFWVSGDPAWIGGYGHIESIRSDYRLINDNLFDITHAEFVHPESFGGVEVQYYRNARPGAQFVDQGMTFEIGDRSIRFRTHAARLGLEGGPLWRSMVAQSRGVAEWNEPVDFRMEVIWWAPIYTSFHISVRPADEPDAAPVEIYNLHAAVPESETSSHYFYRSIRNYGDPSMDAMFIDAANFVFHQDKPILEGQQAVLGTRDLLDTDPISFAGDRLQLEGRRILGRLLAAEQEA
ncbi:aromatic ring-hydroxylating dioxygenase subunit alpha [Rhizorhabdus wittichii]|uniref:aromatic ring-hydroxylating dioxygenase subunit alpha n=1 Tax=Rhizorhabdus wittichii TaxID=160791 RepID=UPI0002E875CA|nr:aromatic ring-hydroxylating dioxygenase subunit alpha [Rhizorhabdus wittichii]